MTVEVPARHAETIGALLVELGAGAVEEQPFGRRARLVVYGTGRRALESLRERARPVLSAFRISEQAARIEAVAATRWETQWTEHIGPQRLTPRFVIEPVRGPTPRAEAVSENVLRIRPGLAFGDGTHPTTRLAARAVERFCRTHPGVRVLDFGTGSGVLAFVAARSGARTVVGIDTDAHALRLARTNVRLNRLERRVTLVRAPARLTPRFDLVVANLEPRALVEAAPSIAGAARRAERVLLTGFPSEQADAIAARFAELGFRVRARAHEAGWTLLTLARITPAPTRKAGERPSAGHSAWG
ncbi:MAG: 50S ribosomal protein L11 methyltransferase [Pseudomonadota bacterium]